MSARAAVTALLWIGGLVAIIAFFWLGPRDPGPTVVTDQQVAAAVTRLANPPVDAGPLGEDAYVAGLRVAFLQDGGATRQAAVTGARALAVEKAPAAVTRQFADSAAAAAPDGQRAALTNQITQALRG